MKNNTVLVKSITKLLEEQWGLENAEFQLIVINAKDRITNKIEVRYTGTAPLTLAYEKVATHYHFLKHLNFPVNDTSRLATDASAQ